MLRTQNIIANKNKYREICLATMPNIKIGMRKYTKARVQIEKYLYMIL
jgi:hypothetical protein